MEKGQLFDKYGQGAGGRAEAVVYALNKGILAGAGLDVTEEDSNFENISVVMNDGTKKDDMKRF
jgi:lactate dehydrogenase-like 2-hydroxyacid dehydrogenase